MNTLRDVVCTLIVMVVVGYLALIPWCLYVLVGVAFVIIVTTLIVLAYGFLMEWRELTADEDASARQRFAEETEALYDALWSWKKKLCKSRIG